MINKQKMQIEVAKRTVIMKRMKLTGIISKKEADKVMLSIFFS